MKGKRPKEREHYVLRMTDGTLVEVTRDVYLEWYQSRRRERYQQERERKYGVCSLEELQDKENFSGFLINARGDLEEAVFQNIYWDKVREILKSLSMEDVRLIELLYFAEMTITDTARILGCSRKKVQNRRKRILKELYQKIKEQGI